MQEGKNKQQELIKIRGARENNLKEINIDIPRGKFVVISGVSGSGKSSLAFDTLYAEGQRRYVESLSAYARQFLGIMSKPDVDKIEGLSPAIAINQKSISSNPRSTVGTITEIYDYLRLLFARIGIPYCPHCGNRITKQTPQQIAKEVFKLTGKNIFILGPVVRQKKGQFQGLLQEIQRQGFQRVKIDDIIYYIDEAISSDIDKNKKHTISVIIDSLDLTRDIGKEMELRIIDDVEAALKIGKGICSVEILKKKDKNNVEKELIFSEHFACPKCGFSLPEVEPRLFSFNAPIGACPDCSGLGEKLEVDPDLVMPNKDLTIAEGAIFPWAHASHRLGRQGFFWIKLQELANKYDFPLTTPVKNLPKDVTNLILYGNGEFEGVVHYLERRWEESEGEGAREEIERYMRVKICPTCNGKRLRPEVLAIKIEDKNIDDVVAMNILEEKTFFNQLLEKKVISEGDLKIAKPILKEILARLQFLINVGLDYLTLNRKGGTLAGGEAQRIRLASQLGSSLVGVTYILDEPSIGLHQRDQERLIASLKSLRDLGNNVIVVEHDSQTILESDWVIDVGPLAGKQGGIITFEGTPKELLKSKTLTGEYLSGKKNISISIAPEKPPKDFLIIKGAREHNLKNINVKIPLNRLVCVTGVSGSGKSSLINDILARSLMQKFYGSKEEPGAHDSIENIDKIRRAVIVDQSPIGRTPRSNPATYTGAFTFIRDIFSQTSEAKIRGYDLGKFSFNVKGGRCEACQGQGFKKVEMYFLPDVYVECEECHGTRYNKEVLDITYKGKTIADVLKMTVDEAVKFFGKIPGLYKKLKTIQDVGLGYIELGQPAPYLSGGEAQRIKLANELSKSQSGDTIYILDEPTTGLHPHDVQKLLDVLCELRKQGSTIIIIEHNLDVIKNCEWIIDLGPEGGFKGGNIVAQGTPTQIAKTPQSWTGRFLRNLF